MINVTRRNKIPAGLIQSQTPKGVLCSQLESHFTILTQGGGGGREFTANTVALHPASRNGVHKGLPQLVQRAFSVFFLSWKSEHLFRLWYIIYFYFGNYFHLATEWNLFSDSLSTAFPSSRVFMSLLGNCSPFYINPGHLSHPCVHKNLFFF